MCARDLPELSAAAAPTTASSRPCCARPAKPGGSDMSAPLTRREFSSALGALVVAFSFDPKAALAQEPARLPGSLQTNRRLDAWLRINADGTAPVFPGKVELGQGILTALPQIAAEKLGLPLHRITMVLGAP